MTFHETCMELNCNFTHYDSMKITVKTQVHENTQECYLRNNSIPFYYKLYTVWSVNDVLVNIYSFIILVDINPFYINWAKKVQFYQNYKRVQIN